MDRWEAGDADGLEVLYALHGRSCYGLALAVLRDAHYAEDAVQEAFVDLWRSRACFDARRSSVRSWLLMLTHRRAVDRVRSEKRRRTSELGPEHDFPDDRSGPDAQVITAARGAGAGGAGDAALDAARGARARLLGRLHPARDRQPDGNADRDGQEPDARRDARTAHAGPPRAVLRRKLRIRVEIT